MQSRNTSHLLTKPNMVGPKNMTWVLEKDEEDSVICWIAQRINHQPHHQDGWWWSKPSLLLAAPSRSGRTGHQRRRGRRGGRRWRWQTAGLSTPPCSCNSLPFRFENVRQLSSLYSLSYNGGPLSLRLDPIHWSTCKVSFQNKASNLFQFCKVLGYRILQFTVSIWHQRNVGGQCSSHNSYLSSWQDHQQKNVNKNCSFDHVVAHLDWKSYCPVQSL